MFVRLCKREGEKERERKREKEGNKVVVSKETYCSVKRDLL